MARAKYVYKSGTTNHSEPHYSCCIAIEEICWYNCLNMKVLEDSKTGYCNLRAKLRDITERWHLKTSKEKFLSLYSIPKWMFEVVGLRVYGDCKLTIYSYFGYVVVVYYLSMVTYTIYYWSCKGQFIYGLRCLCGVGIMISVRQRILTG